MENSNHHFAAELSEVNGREMSIQNFFVAFIHTENEHWERDEKSFTSEYKTRWENQIILALKKNVIKE